jgi:O-6-methylguanine DNA methyltransferase
MVTEWIITEIDGKIASIAADYRHFAEIAAKVAQLPPTSVDVITTQKVSTEELIAMAGTLTWEDFRLFGTKFQLGVWKTLFELEPRLYSYSEFAALCGNPQGVRSVAHAVAINPIAYIFPCHLIIPKESMDKGREIRDAARETTLFKGSDLYLLDTLDVGEYAYGPVLKRELIKLSLSPKG